METGGTSLCGVKAIGSKVIYRGVILRKPGVEFVTKRVIYSELVEILMNWCLVENSLKEKEHDPLVRLF